MTTQIDTMPLAEPGSPQKITTAVNKRKSIFTTGIFQIIGGTIMVLCGFVLVIVRYDISYRNGYDKSAIGIWGGAFVLITGIVGVVGANRKSWLKCYLVDSLISIVILIVTITLCAVAAADNVHYYKEHPGYHHYDDPDYPDQHGISITKLSFHLLLGVVGSLELIVCILSAVFCCTGMCPEDTQEQTVYYQQPAQAPANLYLPPNYAYPPPTGQIQTVEPVYYRQPEQAMPNLYSTPSYVYPQQNGQPHTVEPVKQ